MSEVLHILRGPARSGKTVKLLERCRAVGGTGNVLWLTPSLRRADQLRAQLAGIPGLLLLTFEELAGEMIAANEPELRPLPRCQARLIIDEVIADLLHHRHLSHFERVAETRGFAEGVAGLLGELQRAGVTPAAFRQAVENMAEESQKLGQLAGLYAHYGKRLDSLRLVDPDARLAQTCDILHRQPKARPLEELRAAFIDDFRSFTPSQQKLLDLLATTCEEVWVTKADEDWASAERKPVVESATGGLPPPLAGLAHLERNLFRPIRQVKPSSDATGLMCLQAPGLLGEARMVARQVKTLLHEGVAAEEIVLSVRDLTPYADLLREVFDEYGIPVDVEGTDSLLHDPAVALLLRALRLPDEDWPFAGVTALLRNGFFRPKWQEALADPEVPLLSEALLRLLAEPRGREAYLGAVHRWAIEQQKGLEDEQAQESRRRRTHELAQQCGPFLDRFFHAWDDMPAVALLSDHVAWLRSFADDLGLASDSPGWERIRVEVVRWVERESLAAKTRPIERRTFQRRLNALAATAGVARTRRGPGRVRVLSAPLACDLDVDYLFLLGLGERGFPQLATPSALLDESERQTLRTAGLDLISAIDLLADEMLLFYRLLTRAKTKLVLSYPAVDERGQPLLPSSFLSSLLDLFEPGAVPVERRSMLIEGFDRDVPLSPAEQRVRLALAGVVDSHLRDARELARQRFHDRGFSPFEGQFRDPDIIAAVSRIFRPERVFSPTALEDYVACPFRFFLGHVLRLEPLEEPREEIEVTRRGQSFHRALSRLHIQLRKDGINQPSPDLEQRIAEQLMAAIN
jgi:ATP-dependent helicase/DNAse subunit B